MLKKLYKMKNKDRIKKMLKNNELQKKANSTLGEKEIKKGIMKKIKQIRKTLLLPIQKNRKNKLLPKLFCTSSAILSLLYSVIMKKHLLRLSANLFSLFHNKSTNKFRLLKQAA